MKKVANKIKALWNDESAQGASEYILLLVIVVGVAMLFKDRIKGIISGKLGQLETDIGKVTAE